MCGGENKKYRRVGNECRLTRCPFSIWSVCWSPVKMVCPCVNVHFLVVRVNGCCVVLHLPVTSYLRNEYTTFVYTRFTTFVYPYEIGGVYESYLNMIYYAFF